jgi:hypothetical protein
MMRDLSDEAMAARFGDILFEIPELWEAIRRFEIENRPRSVPGGFIVKGGSVSVQRGTDMLRLRIGNARG